MQRELGIDLLLDDAALDERVEGSVLLDRAGVRAGVAGARVSLWRSAPRRYELTDDTAAVRWDLRCEVAADGKRVVRSLNISTDFTAEPGVQVVAVSPVDGTTGGHRVQASGPRFSYARWVFDVEDGRGLDTDLRMSLLVTAPVSAHAVPTRVTVRTEVSLQGLSALIPLVGRRTDEFTVDNLADTAD